MRKQKTVSYTATTTSARAGLGSWLKRQTATGLEGADHHQRLWLQRSAQWVVNTLPVPLIPALRGQVEASLV